MLEYWYKDRRTLLDFRRGPLGPYFDGFAAHLKQAGYSKGAGCCILSRGCFFNGWLVDTGISRCSQVDETHIEPFLHVFFEGIRSANLSYDPKQAARNSLKRLFSYLFEVGAIKRPKPKPEPQTAYTWMLDPFLKHLREECQLTERTICNHHRQVRAFLDSLGDNVVRERMKGRPAKTVEAYLKQHFEESPENHRRLFAALRRFLPAQVEASFTWKTVQEAGDAEPPAPLISIRTQSIIPAAWAGACAHSALLF